jgi:hypothetical protein
VARAISTFGPLPAMDPASQYAAVALQNPNLEGADMTIALYAADGAILGAASRSLPSGQRLLLEVSELVPGAPVLAGSSVRVSSSLPVQMFGVLVDESLQSLTPRLPIEAVP